MQRLESGGILDDPMGQRTWGKRWTGPRTYIAELIDADPDPFFHPDVREFLRRVVRGPDTQAPADHDTSDAIMLTAQGLLVWDKSNAIEECRFHRLTISIEPIRLSLPPR
jgi:hypothetical protein